MKLRTVKGQLFETYDEAIKHGRPYFIRGLIEWTNENQSDFVTYEKPVAINAKKKSTTQIDTKKTYFK